MSEIWNLSTLCRCCHADGNFKSLSLSYQGKETIEIYESMLQESLGIIISTPSIEASYTICDRCIFRLRDATDFKRQVLLCEQKFKIYCNNEQFFSTEDIKVEVDSGDEDHKDDNGVESKQEIDKKPPLDVKKDNQLKNPIVLVEKIAHKGENKTCNVPEKKKRVRNKKENAENDSKKTQNYKISETLIEVIKTETESHYTCLKCGGRYPTESDIKNHISKEHLTNSYKCEYCPKILKTQHIYKKHIKQKLEKKYKCTYCVRTFCTKNTLREHTNSHIKERKFICDVCNKEFKSKSSVAIHLNLHFYGTNKKFLCEICGWSFNDNANLIAHVDTVHKKLRPFACSKCDKTFSSKRHMRDHLLRFHERVKEDLEYKCDLCRYKALSLKAIKIHKMKHDSKFMCRHCPMIFDDNTSRIQHVKCMHHNKFSCPICGKALADKHSLNRHIDFHNGIRRFACDICGLKFSQKGSLKRHVSRIHNPSAIVGKTQCGICKRSYKNIVAHMSAHVNRPCACDICGKTYPDNRAVNVHKVSKHYGRAFACDVCGKTYIQRAKLATHKLKVHKIKIEKDTEGSERNKL